MNVPPTEFIRVIPDDLRGMVTALFEKANVPGAEARLIADLLVGSDLRGVFSHGTHQTAGYVRSMLNGRINPCANVRLVSESPTTAVFDGDGGLGYVPAYRAAHAAVDKARAFGLGAGICGNHGHFGAAGNYSRIPLASGCIGFAVSSHVRDPRPDAGIWTMGGGSPMSFAFPAGSGPPVVLDMATSFSWGFGSKEEFEAAFSKMPDLFFKSLGLGVVCHGLGGILARISLLEKKGRTYEGATQGAFVLAIEVSRFMPRETFFQEIEEFVRGCRRMQPFPGYERAELPGGPEWEREREWARVGIPVGRAHQANLEEIARELDVPVPWH